MARAIVRALVAGRDPIDRIDLLADSASTEVADLAEGNGECVSVTSVERHGGARHFTRDLPRWLRKISPPPDAVICLTHGPIRARVPIALVVPDLSFEHLPDAFPRATRVRLQTLVRHQAPRALGVLTISEFCRQDLIATYGLDPARVHHVPLHVDPPGIASSNPFEEVRKRLEIPGPFVLYLGNLHPRKNLPAAIAAFRDAVGRHDALRRHQFVVAGAAWWGHNGPGAAADDVEVNFVGRVSDGDRDALIRAADVLVYPSKFEGFGLPPLEAFVRGTPVVASNVTSVPEICGDAALLVDPDDVHAMADAIATVVNDAGARSRLIAAGYRQASKYAPEVTTAALWEALRAMTSQR